MHGLSTLAIISFLTSLVLSVTPFVDRSITLRALSVLKSPQHVDLKYVYILTALLHTYSTFTYLQHVYILTARLHTHSQSLFVRFFLSAFFNSAGSMEPVMTITRQVLSE